MTTMMLSPHFSEAEFLCSCGCGLKGPVSPNLLDLLESIRSEIGRPLYITSGMRCRTGNAAVGGMPNSAHTRGTAADLTAESGRARHEILVAAAKHGAHGIGVGGSFVHVDVDMELYRPSAWGY